VETEDGTPEKNAMEVVVASSRIVRVHLFGNLKTQWIVYSVRFENHFSLSDLRRKKKTFQREIRGL
jgi:hypothetical protein